uniref:Uncharacterized protein n=1 Tax=Coccidioides posadasii RMSCC 3488 TaxID=454284 RepID=A0A0J6F223_COCPO|nr:hypothetical protein CPAG_00475 [Coccidioides posadasii RMSCC 3488]
MAREWQKQEAKTDYQFGAKPVKPGRSFRGCGFWVTSSNPFYPLRYFYIVIAGADITILAIYIESAIAKPKTPPDCSPKASSGTKTKPLSTHSCRPIGKPLHKEVLPTTLVAIVCGENK